VGLRGSPDDAIFEYARAKGLVILTQDLEFGNLLRFPLDTHHGILVARFPNEVSSETLNGAIATALRDMSPEEIKSRLVIVEPGRVRLRKG
jgi:predicted nuclease of predicted toxin-antitoxin system